MVEELSTPRAKAEAILNRLKKTAYANLERDPAYYRKFSQMIEETLLEITKGRLEDIEALDRAKEYQNDFEAGYNRDVPENLRVLRDASAYFGVVKEALPEDQISLEQMADIAAEMEMIIEKNKIVDWTDNRDVRNQMWGEIEDYLFNFKNDHQLEFGSPLMDEIIGQVLDIARKRA